MVKGVNIPITGDATSAKRAFNETVNAAGALDKVSGKLESSFKKLAGALVGLAALDKIKDSMAAIVKNGIEEDRAIQLLAKTITNSVAATKEQLAANEKWITSTMDLTNTADDKLRPALGVLVATTKDLTEAQKLASIAIDVAAARGVEMQMVSIALAKAHDGNMAGLGRLGLSYKDASGEVMSFDGVMQNAIKTYGGAAQVAADTTIGRMERLKLRIEEVKEAMGQGFLPVLDLMLVPLGKAAAFVENLADEFRKVAESQGVTVAFKGAFEDISGALAKIDWSGVGMAVGGAITAFVANMAPVVVKIAVQSTWGWAKGAVTGAANELYKFGQEIRLSPMYKEVEEYLKIHPGISFDRAIGELKANFMKGGEFDRFVATPMDQLKIRVERLELGFTDVEFDEADVKAAIEAGYPADKIAALLVKQQQTIIKRSGLKPFSEMLWTPGEDLTKKFGEMIKGAEDTSGAIGGAIDNLVESTWDWDKALGDLAGKYQDILSPTDAWTIAVEKSGAAADIAAGKYGAATKAFDEYLVELETKIKNLDTFQSNVLSMAAEWAPKYGDQLIQYAALQGPDVVAGFMGASDEVQKKTLDNWWAIMEPNLSIMGGNLETAGGRMGEIMGIATARNWVDTFGLGVGGYLKTLGASISGMYSGIGGSYTKNAEGGIFNRPTVGLFGEAGPELILPLSKPRRMAELLKKAGLAFADGGIVGDDYERSSRSHGFTPYQHEGEPAPSNEGSAGFTAAELQEIVDAFGPGAVGAALGNRDELGSLLAGARRRAAFNAAMVVPTVPSIATSAYGAVDGNSEAMLAEMQKSNALVEAIQEKIDLLTDRVRQMGNIVVNVSGESGMGLGREVVAALGGA